MASIIRSSIAGTVFKVLVEEGASIDIGQEVIVLESMKMEIPVESEVQGRVKRILVEAGSFVDEGDPLAEVE